MAAIEEKRTTTPFNVGTALKRFTMLGLMVLTIVTIWIHEAYFFRGPSPQLDRLMPIMSILAPHIATGAIALRLGPLQFSTTLRRKSLTLHRWLIRT